MLLFLGHQVYTVAFSQESDAGLRPRTPTGRRAPRGSHGLVARLEGLLILHVACHVRRELLEPPLAQSHPANLESLDFLG